MKGFFESTKIKQDKSKPANIPQEAIIEEIPREGQLPQFYNDSPSGIRKQQESDIRKSK